MIKNLNLIKLINCKNNTYDFNKHLNNNHTLIVKNCTNINILVNSKINKVIIDNSNFIHLNITHLINGIEISYSKGIILSICKEYLIPINLYESND